MGQKQQRLPLTGPAISRDQVSLSLFAAILAAHLSKICAARFLAHRSFPFSRFVVARVGRWLRRLSLDPERDDQSRGFDRHSDARSAAVDSGISIDPPGDCP